MKFTEQEIVRIGVRRGTLKRKRNKVLRNVLIAALLLAASYYVLPPLFVWQVEQIDLGLKTQSDIYEGLKNAKNYR